MLIIGGTGEARELAAALAGDGVPVTYSLAGRVAEPLLPPGEVRIGGFGGPDGLARWLADHDVGAVVDASHPFARRISVSAATACRRAAVALTRLERPGWTERSGDRWHRVEDLGAAAAAIPGLGRRVLLTTGRLEVGAFARVAEAWFLVRCIKPPDPPLPPRHEVLLDRGPYTREGEVALLDCHRIDLLVTKDSGGERTAAKLDAARERDLPVIVVRRPPRPDVPTVHTVSGALHRLEECR
ncbi:MAG: cobalt-precorrin-6A reductase [Thermoleophilaceae bacterium]